MIKLRVWKYDASATDYKGTEYTNYVLQGGQNCEDLTQEVDTSEITLYGISQKQEFAPSTKFVIESWENDEKIATYHRIVKQDLVNKPILDDDNYFVHSISLEEPSVIAQKQLVDNIACTYKLKDVSLSTKVAFDLNKTMSFSVGDGSFSGYCGYNKLNPLYWTYKLAKYLKYDTQPLFIYTNTNNTVVQSNLYYTDLNNIKLENNKKYAKFSLPKLEIYSMKYADYTPSSGDVRGSSTFRVVGYASYDYTVKEYNADGTFSKIALSGSIISNSSFDDVPNYVPIGYQQDCRGWLWEKILTKGTLFTQRTYYMRKYADTSLGIDVANTNLETNQFEVLDSKIYKIEFSLHIFNDDFPQYNMHNNIIKYNEAVCNVSNYSILSGEPYAAQEESHTYLNENTYNGNIENYIYTQSSISDLLLSANPYSALLLLEKAISNIKITSKQPNIQVGNINYTSNGILSYNSEYYVDNQFIEELSKTQIVENFYNQKNLWQVLLEIGYYIHAIPEIVFGENEKFMITFNRLGETNQNTDNATAIGINNFRGIDDYISTTNSYITNYVQLGGSIEEWVAPKTSSEDYLVYNDTVNIQVSKPITELLKIEVVANKYYDFRNATQRVREVNVGDIADLTKFVYEKNVYNLLSVRKEDDPNKGIALFYNLYDNVIQGCDYQLPQANNNIYTDYAIKKIIYCAYTDSYPVINDDETNYYWTSIQVNDFSFKITYRTKDTVRQTHTRPDLRKYLVQSKWQDYPTYKQFNNQQDTLIDSEKFGSNMYGTLIRTGNTNYEIQEWVDSANKLKHKGELYTINGELYYVSKATHTYFTDHIESIVEYSKDYNQLSKVIGIPSEPRFYEISEQSSINREVAIDDYLLLTTDSTQIIQAGTQAVPLGFKKSPFINSIYDLQQLIFGDDYYQFSGYPKYAVTTFKGDKDIGSYASTFGTPDLFIDIMSPINTYSSGNTLTFAWDMVDNFSAGNKVIATNKTNYNSLQAVKYADKYGKATLFDFYILSNRNTFNFTQSQVQNLPESVYATATTTGIINTLTVADQSDVTNSVITSKFYQRLQRYPNYGESFTLVITFTLSGTTETRTYKCTSNGEGSSSTWERLTYIGDLQLFATNIIGEIDGDVHNRGLILLKDCRENILFNYNLQLLTSSDTFVTSPFMFAPKEDNDAYVSCKVVLLDKEVNKLGNGYISVGSILTINGQSEYSINQRITLHNCKDPYGKTVFVSDMMSLRLNDIGSSLSDENFAKVKAIALVYGSTNGFSKKFVIARNIPTNLTKAEAFADWHFGTPKKASENGSIFNRR